MRKRIFREVINDVLKIIPKHETNFRLDLEWLYKTSIYRAPEDVLQWNDAAEILEKHIKIPKLHWHSDVIRLFTMISLEDSLKIIGK